MFFYEAAAPTGWVQVSVDRNRLIVLDNSRGGQQAGQHDPTNCSAIPTHDHVLIPQEHTHDCVDTYPADHSGKSAIAYPETTVGNWYSNRVIATSLSIETNVGANNISIRHITCIMCEYQSNFELEVADDYALTMGALRNIVLPTPVPSGTHMVFFQSTAPLGWSQDMSMTDFHALLLSNTGNLSGGTDDPTNITNVAAHTHDISPNPHTHNIYDQDDMTDGGGGEEADASEMGNINPNQVVGTYLTIQNSGTGIGACSPYWCGFILCVKEDYMRVWEDLPDDYAVTVGMLDQLIIIDPAFPSGARCIFGQSQAPTNWSLVDVPNSKGLAVCHNSYGGMNAGLLDPDNIPVCPPHTHNVVPNPHEHDMYMGTSDQSGYRNGGPERVLSHQDEAVGTMLYPTLLTVEQNSGMSIQFYNYYAVLAEKD